MLKGYLVEGLSYREPCNNEKLVQILNLQLLKVCQTVESVRSNPAQTISLKFAVKNKRILIRIHSEKNESKNID